MKSKAAVALAAALAVFAPMHAQTSLPGDRPGQTPAGQQAGTVQEPAKSQTGNLPSAVYDWEKLPDIPTPKGVRRDLFDGPTTTLDKVHCHVTTLNPGENSGEPRLHLQEEIIIVKEGTVEMHIDGKNQTAGPGSVFFLAARATTRLRNAGTTPCTYIVIYYYTPLTPKS